MTVYGSETASLELRNGNFSWRCSLCLPQALFLFLSLSLRRLIQSWCWQVPLKKMALTHAIRLSWSWWQGPRRCAAWPAERERHGAEIRWRWYTRRDMGTNKISFSASECAIIQYCICLCLQSLFCLLLTLNKLHQCREDDLTFITCINHYQWPVLSRIMTFSGLEFSFLTFKLFP